MNVKELKQLLEQYPNNMEVFMAERKTDFAYGLLNNVRQQEIDFKEEPEGESLAKDMVVILDEE